MKTSKTSNLNITDSKILRALYRFQVLTTDLVVRAVGSPNSAAKIRKHIVPLVEKKYLSRFELATTGGRSPYVCVLAEKGMQFLRDDYGYDMRFYKPPSEWRGYSSNFLLHPLELNKFIIAASKINQFDNRIQFLSFERDYELQTNPFYTNHPKTGEKYCIIPDAILQFTIHSPEGIKRRILLVELERNTHKQKDFEEKIRGIYWIAYNKVIEERYNHPLPRVALVSSIGPDHAEWMKNQTQTILKDIKPGIRESSAFNTMFHLATMPALQAGDIDTLNTFIAPSWLHPFGSNLATVLGI